MKEKLTFSDGLYFGCGFWTAGFIFTVVISILGILASLFLGGFLTALGAALGG
ncbi:MAG: hypothetical protein L0332_25325 [Chloroflexi bacterium]|nr:hypothetical protein [Chloroflexota bacterium]MCI0579020.1 hypothetical protein [Chloroflexota bacterium]MCI0646947.1 hypothetical protein [Chloroflexota bacterium]MCI0730019.1 hypothetical protein [Chloroflexota bacterium]